jgi:hypothetical protein
MMAAPDDDQAQNGAMKNLLKKLSRGQRRKRSCARENRWLHWAQSLADRHSRVAANRRGLSLTFLHPATNLLLSCGRWSRAAATIAPQINLSIGLILRSLQQAGGDESASWRKMEWQVEGVKQIESLAADPQASVVKQQINTWQRPLQRVFARAMVEVAGETAPLSRARHETLLVERSLQIVRRVVDERRRVEEQARRTLVAREQRNVSRPTAAAAQETLMQSPRGLRVGAQGMMQTTAPPIDIEQLTDRVVSNIDSRIIAHRERMGRLF